MLCCLIGNQFEELIKVLLRVEPARDIHKRGVLVEYGMWGSELSFHIMALMDKRAFSAFPKEGLQFLRSLKRNNNREWFQKHRGNYEQHVKQPMSDLIEALHADFQKFAPEMTASPKVSAYRIYRDTRFSKDKSPYKTHVAVVFPRSGLGKHEGAGLYLHISTQELLIGGGLYMPLPEDLNAVRNHIVDHPDRFFAILEHDRFRKIFGSLV